MNQITNVLNFQSFNEFRISAGEFIIVNDINKLEP